VRVRLQTYDADSRYKGVRDVVKQGFQKEFERGMASIFVAGMSSAHQVTPRLGLNIVHVLPSTCVTFCTDCILQGELPCNTVPDWPTSRRSSQKAEEEQAKEVTRETLEVGYEVFFHHVVRIATQELERDVRYLPDSLDSITIRKLRSCKAFSKVQHDETLY
jgi:hypothetical protein